MTESDDWRDSETLERAIELFQQSFGSHPTAGARAPGRIEIIGNHTDYNGGPVVGAAIDRGIVVVAALADDECFDCVSVEGVRVRLELNRPFRSLTGRESWVNYPLGVVAALERRGMEPIRGLRLAIASDLPVGAGLSSSAALELAAAVVVSQLQGFEISRERMVAACREAENAFVGVPCGILDQGVSAFGRSGHFVHIDCRVPDFLIVPVPTGVRFRVFNTHKKHALIDAQYSRRHAECMDALSVLQASHPELKWLARTPAAALEGAQGSMTESQFKRARHVIEETRRVGSFVTALDRGDLPAAGRLLFESHESSQKLFENSTEELDFLVERLRGARGVLGARLTGGGFGGAVMAMIDESFGDADANAVAGDYAAGFGSPPGVLSCSTADGAAPIPMR